MPPAVGRMHPSHMSNPFAHLNPSSSIPAPSHYQQQAQHLPQALTSHSGFGTSNLNGGISPFAPSAGNMGYGGGLGNGGGQGLASEAAFRGFERGAALQQQQAHHAEAAQMGMKTGQLGRIREVWRSNLDQEMVLLRELIRKYPYVSMDAEFPGIVARPIGNFGNKASYHYQTLRCNVDLLKPIQLGVTLWNPDGELPPTQADPSLFKNAYPNNLLICPCTWVFNFSFSLDDDMYAEGSIDLLKKAGIDFQKHQTLGIDLNAFGAVLTSSGLTFDEDVNWLSFHSGYDFGYLVKLLSNSPLPADDAEFRELVKTYFPKIWDIKFLLRHAQRTMAPQGRLTQTATSILSTLGQKSGLQDLADELGCQRVGSAHTGGSDAWLTGMVFWAMRNKIFEGRLPEEMADQIYGLHGVGPPASAQTRDEYLQSQGQQTPQTNGAIGFHSGHTPGVAHNAPSTPTTSHANVSGTPGPGHYGGYGGMTPAQNMYNNYGK